MDIYRGFGIINHVTLISKWGGYEAFKCMDVGYFFNILNAIFFCTTLICKLQGDMKYSKNT